MDDLASLFGTKGQGKDLVDKLVSLLDRQTDHKLTPNMLLGFLGLFNVLTIMNVVQGNSDLEMKEVSGHTGQGIGDNAAQSLTESLSGLLKPSQGNGQPDLIGLLGSLASKKKINPNLLLSLLSMFNNQAGGPPQPNSQPAENTVSESSPDENKSQVSEEKEEKKTQDDKPGMELRYDRRRGTGERL